MYGMAVLLSLATLGVDYGWQPTESGELEYIIQIEPELLDAMRNGSEIVSVIHPDVQGIRQFRIRVGDGELPRVGKTAEAAAADHAAVQPDTKPSVNPQAFGIPPDVTPRIGKPSPQGYAISDQANDDTKRKPSPPAAGIAPGAATNPVAAADQSGSQDADDPQANTPPEASLWPPKPPATGLSTPWPAANDEGAGNADQEENPAVPADPNAAAPGYGGRFVPARANQNRLLDPPDLNFNTREPGRGRLEDEAADTETDPQAGLRPIPFPDPNRLQPPPRDKGVAKAVATDEDLKPAASTVSGTNDSAAGATSKPTGKRTTGRAVPSETPKPWLPLLFTSLALFGSLGGNLYLGWVAYTAYQKYYAAVAAR